jgi:hypothetical protein
VDDGLAAHALRFNARTLWTKGAQAGLEEIRRSIEAFTGANGGRLRTVDPGVVSALRAGGGLLPVSSARSGAADSATAAIPVAFRK